MPKPTTRKNDWEVGVIVNVGITHVTAHTVVIEKHAERLRHVRPLISLRNHSHANHENDCEAVRHSVFRGHLGVNRNVRWKRTVTKS